MKKLALILFSLLFVKGFAQITLIPTGSSDLLFYISKLSDVNDIIISGRDGYYVRSIDECQSLIPLPSPTPPSHYQILNRLSSNKAFMFSYSLPAYNSKIFSSIDDCNNWNLVLDTGIYYSNMKFFDANEGYMVGTFGKAIRLKNGGLSRFSSSNPWTVPMMMELYSDSLIALGGTNGGGGGFTLSKDRANTWFGGFGFGAMSDPRDFFYLNKDTMFAISSQGYWGPYFAKSFDGGLNWQKDTIAKNNPYGVYFKNKNEGYILGQLPNGMGVIMKTTNLGQSWSTFNTQIPTTLLDMKFLNDSIALVSGSNGVLFKWNSKASQFITGITDIFVHSSSISVFPNPFNDRIKIYSSEQNDNIIINIVNSLGQVVYSSKKAELSQEIDLVFLPIGVYYLTIENIKGRNIVKFIKE